MQAEEAAEESYADALAQSLPTHVELGAKTKFEGWHKPRKHLVRHEQWGAATVNLITELGLNSQGRPLSYISLPGPDLLDVRVIQSACIGEGVRLLFTGFMGDTEGAAELRVSLMELYGREGVERQSNVYPDALQSIGVGASIGSQNFEKFAPFDVVNIDLCNSVIGAPPLDQQKGCYDAIQRLIQVQKDKRPPAEPWLLFLTTRADRDSVNSLAAENIFRVLLDNCADHSIVRETAARALGLDIDTIQNIMSGRGVPSMIFEKAFAAAVSKWLLGLLSGGNPTGTLSLIPSSCTYGVVKPRATDMISLGFICRNVVKVAPDRAKLASTRLSPSSDNTEPYAASAILSGLAGMRNLDEVLQLQEDYDRAVDGAAKLMVEARFDEARFREWAMTRPESPRVFNRSRMARRSVDDVGRKSTLLGDKLREALANRK